jgi:hypothetical protein
MSIDGESSARAETETRAPRPKRWAWPVPWELTGTLIVAGASVVVAAVGLLGPLTTEINKHMELELEAKKVDAQLAVEKEKNAGAIAIQKATLKHQTEMDFLGKLIDAQQLNAGEIQKNYYRRAVLRFFQATLDDGALRAWASLR